MIVAVNTGRKGSKGFPGKNTYEILGHPLAYYSTKSALDTKEVDKVYMSTDDRKLMTMSKKMGVQVIKRPKELATNKAKSGNVFVHAYQEIKKDIAPEQIEFIVLLMANAFCITPDKISEGINFLRKNPEYDSAVTVSKYNMWNPVRARKIENGFLHPYNFDIFEYENATSDRNDQSDCWFADMGASIVRPRCLHNFPKGLAPQKWMGWKIYPIKQEAGFDIDYEWQVPMVEHWLKTYGGY